MWCLAPLPNSYFPTSVFRAGAGSATDEWRRGAATAAGTCHEQRGGRTGQCLFGHAHGVLTLVLLAGGVWLPERMTHTALSLRHLLDEFGLVATVYSHLLDQAELYLGKVFMEVSVQRNI